MMNKDIRRIGVFAISLVVIMAFSSASNFTEGIVEGCEVVETCEDVLVGVLCVNKTIETCEDVCSIEVVSLCHEKISEVCEDVCFETCENIENCETQCSGEGAEGEEICGEVCETESVCEEVCSEQCNEVINEICKDAQKKICEHINCFEEFIESCDGVIEQKECVSETICNVPNARSVNNENESDRTSLRRSDLIKTTLDLIMDKIESFVESIVTLSATLVDGNNTPVSDKKIEFYSYETIIGSEFTNMDGIAKIDWNTSLFQIGVYRVSARFSEDRLFENSSMSLNILIENFDGSNKYKYSNYSEVNESLRLINNNNNNNNITLNNINNITNNITLNVTITNETGSFYWNHEIVNEYGDVNESVRVRLKVPKRLKQITDEIDFEKIKSNNTRDKEKVRLLKEILEEELEFEYEKVEFISEISAIEKIEFNDLEIIDYTISLGIEEVNDSNFVQSYAIDPSQLNFTDAVVTVIAKGTELYKCKDWNFSLGECYGEWKLFKTGLVLGEEYSFILTANDPGFGEIIAIDAVHLDSNYSFISNVFEEVREKDNFWSETISDEHYVRVTYEKNLTNGNVIDVFVRGGGGFEVYEKDKNLSLGSSSEIDSFNGEWKYITLENVVGSSDIFDFKISGSLEFDYIHDAPPNLTSVVLNSTLGTNLTTEDLTVYTDQDDNSSLKLIYNWKRNSSFITVLNMPFEGGSNSTFTKDYSDNANNATGFNGSLWQSNGGYDGKGTYKFNRSAETYFSVPDFAYSDNFTISFWVKIPALSGSSWHYVYSHGTWNSFNNVRIYFAESNGNLFAQMRDSDDDAAMSLIKGGLDDGNWHFITLTVGQGIGAAFYVDGVFDSSNNTVGTDAFNPGTDLFIAKRSDLANRYFNGWVDDLRVHNSILSLDQIILLNNSQPNKIHSSETSVGDVWQSCVIPNDGIEDGNKVCSNNLTILSPSSGSVSIRIIQSSDDAEEAVDGPFVGDTEIDSSDLEMIEDLDFQEGNQTIGLRFQNVEIPQGAVIDNAYIEFEVDETNTVTTNLRIYGEDEDNPATFFNVDNNITPRTKTTAFASWDNIPAWNTVSEKQQTVDISNVVKEIVDRSGWSSGNSMVFIINGTGKRVAEAWDGESANAPLLIVNWTTVSDDPVVSLNSPANSVVLNSSQVAFNCSATDNNGLQNMTLYLSESNGSNGSVEYLSNYSVWKYNDSNIYPAADWFNEGFDDSSWPNGAARIGVETVSGWLNTTLDGGGDTYPSYYFRTTFNVNSVLDVINMSFNIDYDDGYVVYLNGYEINRSNSTIGVDETDHSALTTATHNWACDGDTPPTCTPGGNSDPVWPKITLNSTHLNYLNDGENTLAVLIKQRTVTSSDSMLMLNLYGYERQYPDLQANETKNISGTSNESIFTLNLNNSYYSWNCLAYDSSGNSDWGDSNRSLKVNSSNNSPQITQIQPIGAITLSQFTTKNVNILFNVTDTDGFTDLNDSKSWCALTKSGEATRNSTSCTAQNQSGNDLVYNCSLDMQFYDDAGIWNVTCFAEDINGASDTNNTETATVNALNYVTQNLLDLNWSSLTPGNNSEEAQSPLVFTNGGNQNYPNFNISSQNATFNSNKITHDRFLVDNETSQSSGQIPLADSGVIWNDGSLTKCVSPCSSNSTEAAYFYVDTPTGIIGGVYASIANWTILLS